MKIDVNKIPTEGLTLEEEIPVSVLELDIETVRFQGPIKIRAEISKITNAVSVNLFLNAAMYNNCSRCLNDFNVVLNKNLKLNYLVGKSEVTIDLNPEIRQEIILDYPIKPLCSPDCKGLCLNCGKNLNEGGCSCAVT